MPGFLTGTVTTTDFTPITDALAKSINAGQVAAIIGIAIGGSVGLVVLWAGARKLVGAIFTAFKSGKIRF